MVRFGILYALLLGASAFAAIHAEPPSFIVDAHGNPWFVRYVSQIQMVEFGGYYVGFTDDDHHEIDLVSGRPLADEQVTLLHELMHIIVGTDQSDVLARIHWCIYEFSEGLQAIFAENPDLVRYLEAR